MSYGFRQVEMSFVYGISHYIDRLVYDMCFRGDIAGLDNVPKKGPYLLACNHASHLDPPFVGVHIPQQVRFFARKTLWKPGFASWWLDAVGTIPVDRDGGNDVTAIKRVLQAMKDEKVVIMFPEGTRSLDGNLQPAKSGVGMFACRTGVPVLPARIFGSFDAFGRNGRVNLMTPISIVYGRPLSASEYDDPSQGKNRYQHASEVIMSRIAALNAPASEIV